MNNKKLYKRLYEKLSTLSASAIELLRDIHKENSLIVQICEEVLAEKYIDELIELKNAPDGAGTPSQGK